MLVGPEPLVGKAAQVALHDPGGAWGLPLMVVPGSYTDTEAERFGMKISTGNVSYSDFNPYENAEAAGPFDGGYGLPRYSFLTDSAKAHTMLKDAQDMDPVNGYLIMSNERNVETLPGIVGTIVYLGDWTDDSGTTYFIAVAGKKIWSRASDGTWTDSGVTLLGNAVVVQPFGSTLMLGYGAAAFAQYQTTFGGALGSILNDAGSPANLYVFAATADRTNAYIAGGTATTDAHKVMASLDGQSFQTASITTTSPGAIVSMAPGGQAATLFIGKRRELGLIDTATPAAYHVVVPFETSDDGTNGTGLGWWMSHGDDPQRGPLMVRFVRDGDPMLYAPGGTSGGGVFQSGGGSAGAVQNIAPWATKPLDPPITRGKVQGFAGSSRFLWFTVTDPDTGNSSVIRRDMQSGIPYPYWDLGVNTTGPIALTGAFGGLLLAVTRGQTVCTAVLPTPTINSLDNTDCTYAPSGTVWLPSADMGFPDEPKIEFDVHVAADNLAPGVRYIQIEYSLDGGSYQVLGTADQSPLTDILFDMPPSDRRMDLRAVVTNTDNTQTPIIYAITMRRSINPQLYRLWEFDVYVPPGSGNLGDDLQNPYLLATQVWAARRAGTPIVFIDQWGDRYPARILQVAFKTVAYDDRRPPQEVMHLRLLQASGAASTTTSAVVLTADTGTAWPLPIVLPTVGMAASYASTTPTVTNALTSAVYPLWTLTGPVSRLVFTSASTGATWTWDSAMDPLGVADTLTINFSPTKKTVVDATGDDRSGAVVMGSTWWGLEPGANSLSLEMWGAAPSTIITLTYATS